MKPLIERGIYGIILAPLAPLGGFLGFLFLAYTSMPEKYIPYVSMSGLMAGIALNIFFLKKLLDRVNDLSLLFWIVVLLFYHACIFGFFMSVPVGNVALAVPAGFVVGGQLVSKRADPTRVRRNVIWACILTTALLACICFTSALVALSSSSTPADLEGLLGLPSSITPSMIWIIILVGGFGLMVVNWILTWLSAQITFRVLNS